MTMLHNKTIVLLAKLVKMNKTWEDTGDPDWRAKLVKMLKKYRHRLQHSGRGPTDPYPHYAAQYHVGPHTPRGCGKLLTEQGWKDSGWTCFLAYERQVGGVWYQMLNYDFNGDYETGGDEFDFSFVCLFKMSNDDYEEGNGGHIVFICKPLDFVLAYVEEKAAALVG